MMLATASGRALRAVAWEFAGGVRAGDEGAIGYSDPVLRWPAHGKQTRPRSHRRRPQASQGGMAVRDRARGSLGGGAGKFVQPGGNGVAAEVLNPLVEFTGLRRTVVTRASELGANSG